MSNCNCCFLTCIQISQEAGQVVWYSHVFKDFPQFAVIHTVKGFSVVSEAEDIFLELSYFFYDPTEQLTNNSLLGSPLLILRSLSSPLILPQVVPLLLLA